MVRIYIWEVVTDALFTGAGGMTVTLHTFANHSCDDAANAVFGFPALRLPRCGTHVPGDAKVSSQLKWGSAIPPDGGPAAAQNQDGTPDCPPPLECSLLMARVAIIAEQNRSGHALPQTSCLWEQEIVEKAPLLQILI